MSLPISFKLAQLSVFFVCLPSFLLAAPVEEGLKQQIAAAGYLRNEEPQWNFLNPVVARSGGDRSPKHPSFDPLAGEGFGFHKKFDSLSGVTFGNQKRNFDEIDNAGFGAFVKKNFDEIDNVGLGFRKRNFDEIDNAGFGAFLKRST